jgi:hypothetical protein
MGYPPSGCLAAKVPQVASEERYSGALARTVITITGVKTPYSSIFEKE